MISQKSGVIEEAPRVLTYTEDVARARLMTYLFRAVSISIPELPASQDGYLSMDNILINADGTLEVGTNQESRKLILFQRFGTDLDVMASKARTCSLLFLRWQVAKSRVEIRYQISISKPDLVENLNLGGSKRERNN